MKLRSIVICSLVVLLASSCSQVTLKRQGKRTITRKPDYSATKSFYVYGLIGEHTVDGKEVCRGRSPVQMQAVDTFVNRVLTYVTLGIYSPRTVKVWCPKKRSKKRRSKRS